MKKAESKTFSIFSDTTNNIMVKGNRRFKEYMAVIFRVEE
jgi:hypothetical protein